MNRRELLKLCLAGTVLSGGILGLGNLGKSLLKKDLKITPKQTDIYKISIPMPFNHNVIDEIAYINNNSKKYKIVNLYNSIPLPFGEKYELFQSGRGFNPRINSIKKFIEYSKHAMDNGLNVVYCINSPNPFTQKEFNLFGGELYNLVEKLSNAGIKRFKVANTQLLSILYKSFDIEFQASTSFEYHNVNQYVNLLQNFPKIKHIDIAIDENRNFEFLSSMRKLFPDVTLELLVDETCLRGCPARISHPASVCFWVFDCGKIKSKNFAEFMMKAGFIYPWDLEYYSALGINSFKFFSRMLRADIKDLRFCIDYLDIVDNGIKNQTARSLNEIIGFNINEKGDSISLAEFKNFLPDIKFFIKNGHKCAVNCMVNCNYCSNLAKNIEQYFG